MKLEKKKQQRKVDLILKMECTVAAKRVERVFAIEGTGLGYCHGSSTVRHGSTGVLQSVPLTPF